MLLGVISDTHGLIRPEAIDALSGSDLIIHAGDVGKPMVLNKLREIAPVLAVRGNIDTQPWAAVLPDTEVVCAAEHRFYVLHDRSQLKLDPAACGYAAVVYGHTHRAAIETREGVLYLNPGSAGPRRFRLPISVAHLYLSGNSIKPEIISLPVL